MTNAFRQKLLNYASSMVLGLAFLGLSLLIEIYVNSENVFRFTNANMLEYRAQTAAWATSNSIAIFLVIMIPVFVWHMGDFVLRAVPSRPWIRQISAYRSLLTLLFFVIIGGLIIHSGVLATLHCPIDDPDDNFIVLCTPSPVRGMLPLVLIPSILLSVLALIKLSLGISSRFG
ncbi:hypothetical protein GRI38_05700 [Altererythrobacter aurantiacus]|uniref:Uncharacterized protein n=1 Tax=Parapontixanthobacter aurantiacus TaxID=1463599 RepID=A0A844ZEX5_9SPHN|nr:hypothetical protein [Parapontixanthobacter aurantiacus]MXO85520.1 hypothetical protein [Parapontixanthobacter aurantiacus]